MDLRTHVLSLKIFAVLEICYYFFLDGLSVTKQTITECSNCNCYSLIDTIILVELTRKYIEDKKSRIKEDVISNDRFKLDAEIHSLVGT